MFNDKEEAKSINLLEPVGSGESVGQISISWLTTIGKWMLIIVEIISLHLGIDLLWMKKQ